MATTSKAGTVAVAAQNKSAQLNPTAQFKQQLLANASPVVAQPFPSAAPPASSPAPQGPDVTGYGTLADYVKDNGPAPVEVMNYFSKQGRTQTQRNYATALAERQLREAGSVVSDNELDSLPGQIKQIGLSLGVVGPARLAEFAATSTPTSLAAMTQLGQDSRAIELYNKERRFNTVSSKLKEERLATETAFARGEINEEEYLSKKADLGTKQAELAPLTEEEDQYLGGTGNPNPFTPAEFDITAQSSRREILAGADEMFDAASNIRESFQESGVYELVNPLNKIKFSEDLGESWEENKANITRAQEAYDQGDYGTAVAESMLGITKLVVAGLGDIRENPAAVFEFVGENTAQLAVGGISKTLMGLTNLQYGVDIYSQAIEDYKENNNGALPSKKEAAIMLGYSLSASAMEHAADTSILKSFSKVPGMSDATAKVLNRLDNGVTNNLVTRTAKKAAGGAAAESVTEGYQTAVEENLSKLNTDFDGAKIYEAAVIGGAVGGGFSTAGGITSEVRRGAARAMEIEAKNKGVKEAQVTAYKTSIETGDTTPLTDRESPTFNLPMAVAALTERSVSEALTEEERAAAQEEVNTLIQAQVAEVKRQSESARKALSEDVISNAELDKLTSTLDKEREILGLMRDVKRVPEDKTRASTETVDTLVTEASTEPGPAREQLLSLMMQDPEAVSEEQVKTLIKNGTGFTAPEQQMLDNYSAYHAQLNSLRDATKVRSLVLHGGEGFKGVEEYLLDATQAIKNNDKASAEAELQDLRTFYTDRLAKLKAVTQAGKMTAETGKKTYAVRDESQATGWRVTQTKPKNWNRASNGGWEAHPRNNGPKATQDIIAFIREEAEAVKAAGLHVRSTLDLAFAEQPAAPAPAVAEATPAPEPVQEEAASINNEQAEVVNEPVAEEAPVEQTDEAPEQAPVAEEESAEPSVDDQLRELYREIEEQEELAEQQPTEVEEEVVELEDGKLPNIASTTAGSVGTLNKEQLESVDLIGAYFEQSPGKEQDKSLKPLADVKDFLSTLFSAGEYQLDLLKNYLSQQGELTPAQANILGVLARYVPEWSKKVAANVAASKTKAPWRHRNYMQYFRDDLPENVQSAVVVSAFTWLAENGNKLTNTDMEIQAILGDDLNDTPTDRARRLLYRAGTRQNLLIQEMGKRVASSLGLKAQKGAPANAQAQLELSLGTHALVLLIQAGMVKRHVIKDDLLIRDGESKGIGHPFIVIAQDQAGTAALPVIEITTAHKNTQGILNRIFGIEASVSAPSLTPNEFNQPTTKGTQQKVPSVLAKILERVGKRKHHIRQDMQRVRNAFSYDNIAVMAGAVHIDRGFIHKTRRETVEAKNAGIEREIQNLQEFEAEAEDKPFYINPVAWVIQRVGLKDGLVNPQTSKFQRHNVSMEKWETEVDPQTDNEVTERFKLAVAQGMGIDVDKQSNAESLKQLDALMTDSYIKPAIQILQEIETMEPGEKLSEEEQAVVMRAVSRGGENFHSLDALMNWAEYAMAKRANRTFRTDMMFEVDGVTNGPALAQIQLGVASPEMGAMFGFYNKAQQYTGFTDYKNTPGNLDIYELVASDVAQALQYVRGAAPILHITGQINDDSGVTSAGRKLLKQPLTSMVFGAGVDGVVTKMGEAFIEMFYADLEDHANMGQDHFGDLHKTITIINDMMPPSMRLAYPETREQAMELVLNPAQHEQVLAYFEGSVGAAVKSALDFRFAAFMETRNELNSGAQGLWARYAAAFDVLYRKKVQERVASGDLVVTVRKGTPVPYQDLTQEDLNAIITELKPLQPLIHTAMSKASGDLEAGIDVSKADNEIVADNDPEFGQAYSAEVKTAPYDSGEGKNFSQMSPRAMKPTSSDPGVRAVIMLIHAMDSGIASYSYNGIHALNIHDALGLGLKDTVKGAKALNKNTFNLLAGYSLPLEIYRALDRSFQAQESLVEAHPELGAVFENITVGQGQNTQIVDTDFLENLHRKALEAEYRKLAFMEGVDTVDQYALEGGSHQVTAEQKTDLAKMKAAVIAEGRALTGEEPKATESKPVTRAAPEDTPFGIVGEPVVDSDPVLVSLVESNPTVDQLIKGLAKRINETAPNEPIRNFQRELLAQIRKTTNPEMEIRLVTPNTAPEERDTPELSKFRTARGWYSPEGGPERLSIKSTAFKHSGITTELLLHELVHGSVAKAIHLYDTLRTTGVKSANPAAVEAVQELTDLHSQAVQFVKSSNLTDTYGAAIESVQEMVAWGMSNPGFQQEVLAQIRMPSTAANRSQVSGLRQFIRSLAKFFFGANVSEAAENGMGVMIANTGLLFEAQQNLQENGGPSLTMAAPNSRTFSSADIFAGLAPLSHTTLSPTFSKHLRGLLQHVADVAYGPGGIFKAQIERSTPATAEDVFLNALASKTTPFASKLFTHLRLSHQEAFVAESVEVTVREALQQSPLIQRELRKLWAQSKKELAPRDFYKGDWDKASQADKDTATATYEFLFNIDQKSDGTADYLSRFVAAGLAYQPLHDKLDTLSLPTDSRVYAGKTIGERINMFFERLMNILARRYTKTYEGQAIPSALRTMAQSLAVIEQRRKAAIERNKESPLTWLENKTTEISKGVRKATEKAAKSRPIHESRIAVVRGAGALVATVAGERTERFVDGLKSLRDGFTKQRLGVTGELINEMRNGRDGLVWANNLLDSANTHEQARKRVMTETSQDIKNSFKEALTEEQLEALTRIVRADTSLLIEHFSLAEIEQLLSDPQALDTAIKQYESQLTSAHRKYYLLSAKGLGYFLSSGRVRIHNLMMNAHNIAFLANTQRMATVSESEGNAAMAILDPLISLYALRYTGQGYRESVADIMRTEAARTDGDNGVKFLFLMHREFQKDSQENLFEGSPIHMIKGYNKDIRDPHVEVVAASLEKGKLLEKAGYTRVSQTEISQDVADTSSEPRYLYSIHDKGLRPTVTGFMPTTGRGSRGNSIHSGVLDMASGELNMHNAQANNKIALRKHKLIEDMFNTTEYFDPGKAKHDGKNHLVPILDMQGQVTNYRYLMEDSTKDIVLKRNNRIDAVMGNTAGSIMDKGATPKMSAAGVDAFKAQFDEDYLTNQKAYIDFSPQNEDPVIRERYRLLPEDTKKHIRDTWGRNGMWVRNDAYNIAFGFRKYSLSEMFDKFPQYRNNYEKVFIGVFAGIFGEKAALRVLQAENVWEEVVSLVKDIWVIKSLITLLGNESSNLSILILSGVPITEIIRHKITAYNSTLTFERDRKEQHALKRKVDYGYVVGQELAAAQQRILELEDILQRNPVKDLMDAGQFQTLVEDIAQGEDPYSYKSRLNRWADEKTDWVPGIVKTVGKTVLMTHDTPLYKVLNKATTLSDFTSRFVLYQHQTRRRIEPLSKAEALRRARAAFVNYDVPTHKSLQYLNDTGLLWFTKYYLRIQAVILQLVRENPLRVLALMGINEVFSIADILDSSALSKSPVNLGAGALELPGALDELLTTRTMGF